MKTTIDIEDGLLIEAKKRAVELRRPLRWLVETALRERLDSMNPASLAHADTIEWVTVDGGLPEGIDPSDRPSLAEAARARGDGS